MFGARGPARVLVVVGQTASGEGLVDLRVQVVDPNKAIIFHDEENPPALIDESTGNIISTPLMDHGHDNTLRAGLTYPTLLLNSGDVLKPGSVVTIQIGGYQLEHVIVQ